MNVVQSLLKPQAVAAWAALTSLALPVAAHPGHAEEPVAGLMANLAHLLTEPDHLALLALAVAVGVVARRLQRARQARQARRSESRRSL
jgi:hydrogenase/urease accessory protein HupE